MFFSHCFRKNFDLTSPKAGNTNERTVPCYYTGSFNNAVRRYWESLEKNVALLQIIECKIQNKVVCIAELLNIFVRASLYFFLLTVFDKLAATLNDAILGHRPITDLFD